MADDPDSPTTDSRPVSRAGSTTTERPGSPIGPRSLAREVDHIKALLVRGQTGPRQNEGSITAQLFRQPVATKAPVSQARILHELDLLRKRIRHEVHHNRSPSQVDPDQSESEAEDVPDERDEELEGIREELQLVRQQREEWIAAAEERIDKVTEEKEGLADLLH